MDVILAAIRYAWWRWRWHRSNRPVDMRRWWMAGKTLRGLLVVTIRQQRRAETRRTLDQISRLMID